MINSSNERITYKTCLHPNYIASVSTHDHNPDKFILCNPYLFTGRQADILDNSSLTIQYSRNRYYDYCTGRCTTHDPLGITPNSQMFNEFDVMSQYTDGLGLYEYVNSNPASSFDPFGTFRYCGLDCLDPHSGIKWHDVGPAIIKGWNVIQEVSCTVWNCHAAFIIDLTKQCKEGTTRSRLLCEQCFWTKPTYEKLGWRKREKTEMRLCLTKHIIYKCCAGRWQFHKKDPPDPVWNSEVVEYRWTFERYFPVGL